MNHQSFINQVCELFSAYTEKHATEPNTKVSLARKLFDEIQSSLLSEEISLSKISAENAVLEVIDKESGLLFRRYLELQYDENSSGILLTGEDMAGNASQIVYLSASALEKINELHGAGPDIPRCE